MFKNRVAALLVSLALPFLLQATSAHAEKVLRIATTLSDIPLTTGQASQGSEGVRFIGITLYDSLLAFDLSRSDVASRVIPALAESYSVDPQTHLKWTFKIRPGVKFHDGSTFDANAAVWNLDKLLNRSSPQFDQNQATQGSTYVSDIASYRAVDPMTLEITTKQPDSVFFYQMAQVYMSSPARWKEMGGDWNKVAMHPSGTGPWMMDKLVPHERAELIRNPNYWDKTRIPKSDRLVLLMMPDPTTRVAALLSGQVDWVEAPPPDAIPRLKSSGMQIVTNIYPHVWPIQLNLGDASPFHDIRVRKAANLAIDRKGLVDFLGGTALAAKGMVDPKNPWFGKPTFDIKYDPDEAKRLMKEAGYGPDHKAKITILGSSAGSGQMQSLAMNEYVQESLNAVGFDVHIQILEWEALRARRRAGAFAPENKGVDGITNSWSYGDPIIGLLSVASSTQRPPAGFNWGGFNDSKADALVKAAMNEFDPTKLDGILAQLHAEIVDQAEWVWVVHDLNPRALSPKVKGFIQAQSWFQNLSSAVVN